MDALGSAIRVDARGAEVHARAAARQRGHQRRVDQRQDPLRRRRPAASAPGPPYVRVGGKLQPATWAEAFDAVAAKIKAAPADRIGVIAGDLQDAESLKATKDLFTALGVGQNLDCRQDGSALGYGPRESWLFNSTIAGIENADVVC
jgi:NADH-quinone oxidoreductase subunit G